MHHCTRTRTLRRSDAHHQQRDLSPIVKQRKKFKKAKHSFVSTRLRDCGREIQTTSSSWDQRGVLAIVNGRVGPGWPSGNHHPRKLGVTHVQHTILATGDESGARIPADQTPGRYPFPLAQLHHPFHFISTPPLRSSTRGGGEDLGSGLGLGVRAPVVFPLCANSVRPASPADLGCPEAGPASPPSYHEYGLGWRDPPPWPTRPLPAVLPLVGEGRVCSDSRLSKHGLRGAATKSQAREFRGNFMRVRLAIRDRGMKVARGVPEAGTGTAGIDRSNTAVRTVLEQPCSTGGRTGTTEARANWSDRFVRPVPAGPV
ncbi:hypothetical protein PCASD_24275 [Puccinia coronata f. sp. avenae]|uniref:Uncharacterized protein n=1 Tax=Puccinia coronata f. sp. avenae TaxID=200324 RepID=A0A2N5SFZ4_9BASI|nr:hypothetical protein PCASD_24275 [Puccinia coronata f. sp. avenae]